MPFSSDAHAGYAYLQVQFPDKLRRQIRKHNHDPSKEMQSSRFAEEGIKLKKIKDPKMDPEQQILCDLWSQRQAWNLNIELFPEDRLSFDQEYDTFFKTYASDANDPGSDSCASDSFSEDEDTPLAFL